MGNAVKGLKSILPMWQQNYLKSNREWRGAQWSGGAPQETTCNADRGAKAASALGQRTPRAAPIQTVGRSHYRRQVKTEREGTRIPTRDVSGSGGAAPQKKNVGAPVRVRGITQRYAEAAPRVVGAQCFRFRSEGSAPSAKRPALGLIRKVRPE